MPKKTIKELPSSQRPIERLLKYGPHKLKDEELLAIILRTGTKKKNVVQLSRQILRQFNKELIDPNISDLIKIDGLGKSKASQIVACFELGKRFLKDKQTKIYLSPEQIFEEVKDIRGSKKEHLVALYLDPRNQEIKKEIISIGTVNEVMVHPREVFEPAVKNLATQIVIVHNHPTEQTHPSEQDIELTKRLDKAGKILGIELKDHIIVTSKEYYSFKMNNLL